jgi:hypothetical protein
MSYACWHFGQRELKGPAGFGTLHLNVCRQVRHTTVYSMRSGFPTIFLIVAARAQSRSIRSVLERDHQLEDVVTGLVDVRINELPRVPAVGGKTDTSKANGG